jgi:hypothetical protein
MSRGVELPPYYEPQYKFEMEILRFDSSRPSPRYSTWVDDSRDFLQTVPVISAKPAERPLEEIQIAVAGSFRHTDGTSGTGAISDQAAWERSTGVA